MFFIGFRRQDLQIVTQKIAKVERNNLLMWFASILRYQGCHRWSWAGYSQGCGQYPTSLLLQVGDFYAKRQLRHGNSSVHWCSELMAYVGKKFRFSDSAASLIVVVHYVLSQNFLLRLLFLGFAFSRSVRRMPRLRPWLAICCFAAPLTGRLIKSSVKHGSIFATWWKRKIIQCLTDTAKAS